jgi:hypothetical protein
LLLLRPVAASSSLSDSDFRSRIVFRSNWFSLLRICAMDRTDSNQILGSSGRGRYSPRGSFDNFLKLLGQTMPVFVQPFEFPDECL